MYLGPNEFQINSGKKYSTASLDDLTKLVTAPTDSWNTIDYCAWKPASENPKLTPNLIGIMLEKLVQTERYCNVTRNQKSYAKDKDSVAMFNRIDKDRDFTIDKLMSHKNFNDDTAKFVITTLDKPYYVLNSPNLTAEHVDMIFNKSVIRKQKSYDDYLFERIIKKASELITTETLSRWYGVLKQLADWGDNGWSRIIAIFLSRQCPVEILQDVCSTTNEHKVSPVELERLRTMAINHSSGNKDELMALAYTATSDVKYLSDEAKDIFLF